MAEERWQIHAHRGGRAEFDENTLSAFQASHAKGLRGFETDVRMSKDGVLVIMHDDSIDGTTQGTGAVEDLTESQLRGVRTRRGNPLLFLDELVAFFADKPGIYVEFEMKTDVRRYPQGNLEAYCRKLYESVVPRMPGSATVLFTSFDRRPLTWLKNTYPGVDLMLITGAPCCDTTIRDALELGVKRLACTWDGTTRAGVRAAHQAGLVVAGWPGTTVDDYLLGVALGFDHMCADNPVEVLEFKNKNLRWLK
jgi:glycerophosphoryl diester phosphodiesterase